ncbi:MAG: hypothetical protein Q8T08_11865 [Ignavibacteria bacterium]|nr:hypothetical protein [Ignavibacteria bacterium]
MNKVIDWIKSYVSGWSFTRILRLILAGSALAAYFSTNEQLYLVVGLFLGVQAILNMSCPGGSCEAPAKNEQKPVMKFKKLDITKK